MTKSKGKPEPVKAARSQQFKNTLRERAMLVRFATGRWYGRGADDDVVRDVKHRNNALGDVGTFTKRFMQRDRMASIDQAVNDARKIHKQMTRAWGDFGVRMLPATLFFDYKKEMTACEMRFNAAVEEFISRFDEFKAAEKARLNGLFKDADYPSKEDLRRRYYWKLNIDPIPDAEDFRVDLGAEEMSRVRADIEKEVKVAFEGAITEVWEQLFEQVEKIKERLASSDTQVRSVLFDNLKDLIVLLPKFNVLGDPKLTEMGERITKELLSEDLGALREDEKVRGEVAKKADKILDAMKTFTGQKKGA
jgi:hypothetical protein